MRLLLTATLAVVVLAPGTASAQEPTPAPTATPAYDCAPVVEPVPSPVPAWGLDGRGGTTVTVQGNLREPGGEVVLYGYTRPSTQYRELARARTDERSVARIPLPVNGSTRLYATAGGCVFPSRHEVLVVQARLGSLSAHRHGVRDYSFSAFYAGPAGKVGNLYRVLPDGREVLTSQTRLGGEWAQVRRAFQGSGRFGFVLRAGDDVSAKGASTNVRETVVH